VPEVRLPRAFDELVDDLVRAQDVNQAGFYTMRDEDQRAARRAVIEAFDALRAEVERLRPVVAAARAWRRGPSGMDDTAYFCDLIAAVDAAEAGEGV
jgi:hypothetical protein